LEKILSKWREWAWYLTLAAVVLAPSFRDVDYKTYAVSIGFLFLLLLQALGLFKKPEITFSPLELYLALYVGWACLSFFWSPVDLAASEYLGRFLPCVGFFLLVRQEPKDFDGSKRILIWTGLTLLAALYGLLQKAGLDFVPLFAQSGSSDRIFATFGNPNVYAAFLVLTAGVVLLGPVTPRKYPGESVVRILLLVFLFANLIFSESRSGFLGFTLGFFLMVFLIGARAYRDPRWKFGIILLTLLVMMAGVTLGLKIGARPTERLEVWKCAFQMALAKPLRGWGIGQFSLNFGPYMTPELAGQMQKDNTFAEHVHNELLELIVELGLVGLSMACLFWVRLVERAFRKLFLARGGETQPPDGTLGLIVGLSGVGVTNFFDYNCRLSGVSFFIWVSAALLANRVFPADRIRLPKFLGILLAVLLLGGFAFGMVQETRLLAVVLTENPQKDFLKELPPDLVSEEQNIMTNIKMQPGNAENYHSLGNLYAKLGKLDDAKKLFERELELNPKSEGAYLNLGNIYLVTAGNDLGKIQMARECYEKSIQLNPQSIEGHFNLAYVYFLHKDLREALDELDKVLKLDPQNAKALALKRQILP
jgi:O-antigen ligase